MAGNTCVRASHITRPVYPDIVQSTNPDADVRKPSRRSAAKPKRKKQTKPTARKARGLAKRSKRAERGKPKLVATVSKGGGNATAGGVTFQASVGAIFATQLLAERTIDPRLGLGNVRPKSVRFETDAPIDDIVVETDHSGWVLVQAKNSLTLSAKLNSELGKTAEQIVRQWIASLTGTGTRGWNRPLDISKDRFVIAVGPGSSATLTTNLEKALASRRATHTAPLPAAQRDALRALETLLKAAWRSVTGAAARVADIQKIIPFISVLRFDVQGPDRTAATETVAHVTERQNRASAAFLALERACQNLMVARQGADAPAFRLALDQAGIELKAPPSYAEDVEKLRRYSAEVAKTLGDFETISSDGKSIRVPRKSTQAVARAAKDGSLLIIGDPGAGKSAVVNRAAEQLRAAKHEVIQLAVDRLQVGTLEGLQSALGLSHPLLDVLKNWPGMKPAFLFIDALDATRGGQGEAVFRTLIGDVLAISSKRWRVIASIRSFDLRLGERFRELFPGRPADKDFSDASFGDVRHINIPRWSSEELAILLKQAPSLATAIAAGGSKLQDLALVPFNTRLLADLISGGTSADAFGLVRSQVELLSLYWRKRVNGIGAKAEVCLTAIVDEMVTGRTLQAAKITGAAADAAALDALLQQNVLVPILSDRYVAFRHHILFDYAASRVFIDPVNITATALKLQSERDLALMLAPALSYALQELWLNSPTGRLPFWTAIRTFAGDPKSDPITRSVAARMACELPETPADAEGLVTLLRGASTGDQTFRALQHIIGALHVRGDDKQAIATESWSVVAAASADHLQNLAWSLRSLLSLLVPRARGTTERAHLGRAARALLTYSLEDATAPAARLVPSGIDLVLETYATDTTASRDLLSRLLAADRMATHAHQDMSALARGAKALIVADPSFLVSIFRSVFGHTVTDTSATSLGSSQILPLTSNKRQDFEHAKWELKEIVPRFLQESPEQGLLAICAALEANVIAEHKPDAVEQTFVIDGHPTSLIDDYSHIWASDPDDPHAHAVNEASIIGAFRKRIEAGTDADAAAFARLATAHVKLAVLWSRLFLVAAHRPAALGPIVWPYASAKPFLLSGDTRKYAIDAVAAIYQQLAPGVREQFETELLTVTFEGVENPERSKLRFLATVFRTIGSDNLATETAKTVVKDATTAKVASENHRPFQLTGGFQRANPYWFLEDKGIDLEAPANRAMLQLIEALPQSPVPPGATPLTLEDGLAATIALAKALSNASSLSVHVTDYAEDSLIQACDDLAKRKDELRASPASLDSLIGLVSPYLEHARPALETKPTTGPRAVAVEAGFRLCAVNQATADLLLAQLESALSDPVPSVRLAVAKGFPQLWEFRRSNLWRIAMLIATRETSSQALHALAGFLCRALHHDPEYVEAVTIALMPRAPSEEDIKGDRLVDAIGNLIAILWLRYERATSRAWLDTWLNEPVTFQAELRSAVSTLRDVIVGGYRSPAPKDAQLQRNSQQLAREVTQKTATMLASYLAVPAAERSADDDASASAAVRLLDHVCDQLYYSAGAFRANAKEEPTGLVTLDAKIAFLNDMSDVLGRIGEVGSPHTIYNLIDLLHFLTPGDPLRVFDLVANALLNGGRLWGYQFESLGADRFAELIGMFLADHRELFKDPARREKLIACLDVFVDAGWPSARRLLYRLPELL
jgi:hypothetical protein